MNRMRSGSRRLFLVVVLAMAFSLMAGTELTAEAEVSTKYQVGGIFLDMSGTTTGSSWTWNGGSKTLTFTADTSICTEGTKQYIMVPVGLPANSTIIVNEGVNVVLKSDRADGIYCEGALTIKGTGTLYCYGSYSGQKLSRQNTGYANDDNAAGNGITCNGKLEIGDNTSKTGPYLYVYNGDAEESALCALLGKTGETDPQIAVYGGQIKIIAPTNSGKIYCSNRNYYMVLYNNAVFEYPSKNFRFFTLAPNNNKGNYYYATDETYYTVAYDINGGTGFESPLQKQVKKGDNADLTVQAGKSGMNFLGWNTDRNASAALDSYTVNGNVTLHAIYGPQTNDVTFYGDMEGNQIIKTQTVQSGAALNTIEQPTDPPKSGYYFAGWTTKKKTNTSVEYNYKQAVPDSDKDDEARTEYPCILVDWNSGTVTADMSFYPVFIKDRLKVKLVPGGDTNTPTHMGTGSDGKTQSTEFTVNIDELIHMKGLLGTTRDGYTLEGWYTAKGVKWNPNGTADDSSTWWRMTPEYADNNTPVKHESLPYNFYTVTLTAHWTPKEVSVEYDLADGTASGQAGSPTASLGSTLTLPGAPTKSKFKFTGWKIGNDATLHSAGETLVFDNWSLVEDGKLTVTAQYIDNPTRYIAFETNDGSAIEPITATAGTAIVIPDAVKDGTAISKIGHTFAGWYKDSGFTAAVNDSDWPTTMPDTSTTFYAKWTVNQYTISFNMNGAESGQIQSITQDYDTDITKPADPTKLHYTFKNWSPAIPDKMPADNLTVEAVWEPTTYKMTFKENAEDPGTVREGKYGDLVTPPNVNEQSGLAFVGWSVSSPIYMPGNNETVVTAKWKPNPVASPETVSGKHDGKITGVSNDMVYSVDGGKTWEEIAGTELTNLSSGTYWIKYKDSSNNPFHSDVVSTVTVECEDMLEVSFEDEYTVLATYQVNYNDFVPNLGDQFRDKCRFLGWHNGDKLWDFTHDRVEHDMILKATWQEITSPVITNQPGSLSWSYGDAPANRTLSVDVEAVGADEIIKYQWYQVESGIETAISDATEKSYMLPEMDAGKYEYYCIVTKVVGNGSYSVTSATATVTVNPVNAVAATVTANNRTYDLTTQPLVKVDNSTLVGGTMNYAIGTNATTAPDDSAFTPTVPTATNAGTYYVWYIAKGDETHTDSAPQVVTVEIAAPSTYTVTVTNDGHGTGAANPASGVTGTEVTLTNTPAEGYQFKEWQVISGGVTVADNQFTIGTANVEVKAVFEALPEGSETGKTETKSGAPVITASNMAEVVKSVAEAIRSGKLAGISEEVKKALSKPGAVATLTLVSSPLSDSEVPAQDKAALDAEAQANGYDGYQAFDLTLKLTVTDPETNQTVTASIHLSSEDVTFTLQIPEGLKKTSRTFYLLGCHDGKVSNLASTTAGTITGKSKQFSTYAIAYKDAEEPPKPVSSTFYFKKVWEGSAEKSIDFTLYSADGKVIHQGFEKHVLSAREWSYSAVFTDAGSCYVIEKPIPGYITRYMNVGEYAGITDRCYDGGTIINKKIPKTGDEASLLLWAGMLLTGAAGLTVALTVNKRRKAHK